MRSQRNLPLPSMDEQSCGEPRQIIGAPGGTGVRVIREQSGASELELHSSGLGSIVELFTHTTTTFSCRTQVHRRLQKAGPDSRCARVATFPRLASTGQREREHAGAKGQGSVFSLSSSFSCPRCIYLLPANIATLQQASHHFEQRKGGRVPAHASSSYCSLTKRPATPNPVPAHMLVMKVFAPVLFASAIAVAIWRPPVAPKGWPRAIAPPTGFTLAWSSPRVSMHMSA